jgi:hypothetical protein
MVPAFFLSGRFWPWPKLCKSSPENHVIAADQLLPSPNFAVYAKENKYQPPLTIEKVAQKPYRARRSKKDRRAVYTDVLKRLPFLLQHRYMRLINDRNVKGAFPMIREGSTSMNLFDSSYL